MSVAIAEPPNMDKKDGRKCTLHMMFNSETCSRQRKLIKSKVVPYKDASRSEQRAVVRYLIAGDEFNAQIYRRIVAVYGEDCSSQTSWNSWCKSFREGHQTMSDHHDNVRPHISHATI
ncbi:hypothetical protein TNCV_1129441 [Trichonephila clavipes]|nr:hypothetical protein TNCV_1129441 [Trichonephila clavipes]